MTRGGDNVELHRDRNAKSASRRRDERAAFALAGALSLAIPSLWLTGMVGVALALGFIGTALGVLIYPAVETRI